MGLISVIFVMAALLAGVLPASASVGGGGDFTRYQVILDRRPFGDIAASAAAAAAAVSANPNQPPLSTVLRLVALEIDDKTKALQAGLVDGPGKKNYYLFVGQEEDGVKLVDADYAGDRALVRKGDQEEWLAMGSGGGAKTPSPAPNLVARRTAGRDLQARRNSAAVSKPAEPVPTGVPRDPNLPKFKNQAEMDEYYRKINLDLIRAQGEKGPPLPVPLTAEDDKMLVEEGVLPPSE